MTDEPASPVRHDAVTAAISGDVHSAASQWLRAGAPGDWAWWCTLTDGTRAEFAAAGDELRLEQAALIAEAVLRGPAQVLAPIDNGDALIAAELEAAAGRMVDRVRGGTNGG